MLSFSGVSSLTFFFPVTFGLVFAVCLASCSLLPGPLNKRLIIAKVSHNIPGESIFDYRKVGYDGINLLGCALLRHNPKHVLVLSGFLAKLLQRVVLLGNVQLGSLPLARVMRKHLPAFELLHQAILIMLLQFLNFLCEFEPLLRHFPLRNLHLHLLTILLLPTILARIRQIIKTFRWMFLNLLKLL